MNYNHMIKIIALVVLTLICITTWVTGAKAGGPWNDQYCDVEITKVKVVDAQGTVIDNHTEEKVVCSDGAKDFLHGMGIAKSCEIYTWFIPLNGVLVEQRSIACKKIEGGYEIVKGYHNLN